MRYHGSIESEKMKGIQTSYLLRAISSAHIPRDYSAKLQKLSLSQKEAGPLIRDELLVSSTLRESIIEG